MSFTRKPGTVNELSDALAALAEVGPEGLTALVELADDTGPQITALVEEFTADQLEAIASISEEEYEAIASALGTPAALTEVDDSTVDTTYGQEEADVLASVVVAVGEIQALLVALGFATVAASE